MNDDNKELEQKGKYSALEISLIYIKDKDVLCGSKENGAEWGNGDDGWNFFD